MLFGCPVAPACTWPHKPLLLGRACDFILFMYLFLTKAPVSVRTGRTRPSWVREGLVLLSSPPASGLLAVDWVWLQACCKRSVSLHSQGVGSGRGCDVCSHDEPCGSVWHACAAAGVCARHRLVCTGRGLLQGSDACIWLSAEIWEPCWVAARSPALLSVSQPCLVPEILLQPHGAHVSVPYHSEAFINNAALRSLAGRGPAGSRPGRACGKPMPRGRSKGPDFLLFSCFGRRRLSCGDFDGSDELLFILVPESVWSTQLP